MESRDSMGDMECSPGGQEYLLPAQRPSQPIWQCHVTKKSLLLPVLGISLLLLCILNFLTFHNLRNSFLKSGVINTDSLSGSHALQTVHTFTPFSSPDRATTDTAWDSYKINGFVALPHSWISDLTAGQGPFGRPMPDDPSKGLYVVDAMHQLHCLMSIRALVQSIMDDDGVQNRTHVERHLNHCYDALRQAVVCRADATPLYVPEGDTLFSGDGQSRQCADWRALEEWMLEHTACYGGVKC